MEYDTIFEDEAGSTKLKEWFRIPPPGPAADLTAAAALAASEGGHPLHEGLNFQMRPKPPVKVRRMSDAG